MTVKEVTVSITDPTKEGDESRPIRRRRTRKVGGAEASPADTITATTPTLPTPPPSTTTATTATPTPVLPSSAAPSAAHEPPVTIATNAQATITSTSTTTITPQSAGVQIKTRKRTHGSLLPPTPVPSKSVGAARILPIKRHAMPSKEKPILRVPQATPKVAATAAIAAPAPAAPAVPTKPAKPTTSLPPSTAPIVNAKPIAKKRRFTERRIGISVRSLKNTRKARKSIRKQVAAMSTAEIRKVLTEKGVIKASSNPPETMLRSLMKDYLSLKH